MARMIYICKHCNSYCDDEICYVCDESSGELKIIEDTKEDLAFIKNELNKLNRSTFDVVLSEFGDAPGEIATVSMDYQELIKILESHDFIFNDINAVSDGRLRECIGIALLNPLIFTVSGRDEEVNGLLIFTEY